MAQGFWRLTLIAPIGGKIQKWNLWVKSSFCWATRCLSVAANSHRITCCLPLDVLQEKLHFMNQNYRYIKNIYWTFKYLLLSTVRQLAILDIDNVSPDTDNISCTIYLLLWSWLVCNGWQLVVLCYSLHNKFIWGNIINWCLWCYSECASRPGKLKSLPDHGENATFGILVRVGDISLVRFPLWSDKLFSLPGVPAGTFVQTLLWSLHEVQLFLSERTPHTQRIAVKISWNFM